MFTNLLTDVTVVVVVLGSMIFFHELGHFIAAKYFGVRVLTFSFGFGPRLVGHTYGDTDYRLSALPLGGYVKMAGDDPTQDHKGDPREFLSKPRWQRFIIAIMGPTMNVFLAVAVLTGLYRFHYEKPAYKDGPARIGDVEANSPAAQAGFLPGDVIERVGNLANPKWDDVEIKILTSVGERIPVEVEREGKQFDLTVMPRADGEDAVGYAGWTPYLPAILDSVEPGLPASNAGLKAGDQILGLDGKKVLHMDPFTRALQAGKGKPADLDILRQGKEFHVQVTPVYSELGGETKWRIGALFRNIVVVEQLPWGQALASSVDFNVQNSLLTFDVLGKILTRRMSARSLSGPIGIAQISGEAYRSGVPDLLSFVSLISMQLAIFNLLPVPVLDGGVMLLLLVEGAIRRDLSLQVKERVVQAGLVILLFLVIVVTYFDLIKTFRPS